MNRTFEWGVVIATFLSVLSIVHCHCARLTYFLQPKLRKINAVLITLKLITLAFALRRAVSAPCGISPSPLPLPFFFPVPTLTPAAMTRTRGSAKEA